VSVRRPYLVYILAVMLPATLIVVAGALLGERTWGELRRASQGRVGMMALAAHRQDMASWSTSDTPVSVVEVGRATGHPTALYVEGRREVATEPPPGPEVLEAELLDALASSPEGIPWTDAEHEGMLVAPRAGSVGERRLAVLVAAPRARSTAIPMPQLLVSALLLVFASLAGWIQLAGHPRGGRPASFLLVAMVPVLTAWVSLIQADRLYREAVADTERMDLTRAMAVARVRGVTSQPALVHGMTGFHAYRVDERKVLDASLPGDAPAVASLPPPPSSFTTAGMVRTPEGDASYVALRLPEGGFAVAVSPLPAELTARYGRVAAWLGGGFAAWLALVAVVVWRRRPRAAA